MRGCSISMGNLVPGIVCPQDTWTLDGDRDFPCRQSWFSWQESCSCLRSVGTTPIIFFFFFLVVFLSTFSFISDLEQGFPAAG